MVSCPLAMNSTRSTVTSPKIGRLTVAVPKTILLTFNRTVPDPDITVVKSKPIVMGSGGGGSTIDTVPKFTGHGPSALPVKDNSGI